jgi:hypothetical protein
LFSKYFDEPLASAFHEACFSVISFFVHPVLIIILSRHGQGRAKRFLVGGGYSSKFGPPSLPGPPPPNFFRKAKKFVRTILLTGGGGGGGRSTVRFSRNVQNFQPTILSFLKHFAIPACQYAMAPSPQVGPPFLPFGGGGGVTPLPKKLKSPHPGGPGYRLFNKAVIDVIEVVFENKW